MKSLNRNLSLVLVLVMVFSLFGMASASDLSDFTDSDTITYTEAVDFLTAAGVVQGMTATTLDPKGSFTREQAAKLVAYACVGQNAADTFKATKAPFNDVAADRWSAGYISYCVSEGIIAGYGDGNFGPTANVTGYQIGKMLLSALGYGKNQEFIGAGWELEVAKLGLSENVYYGNTAGATNGSANREEAFLYTFNTLTRTNLVKYNASLDSYYAGTNPFDTTGGNTIASERFDMVQIAATGDFDEVAHYWAKDGVKVTEKYADDEIKTLATATSGTDLANLVTKSNSDYVGYAASTAEYFGAANGSVQYFLNGVSQAYDAVGAAAVAAAVTTRGAAVTFLDLNKDNKYEVVNVVNATVKKITATPTTTTSGSVTLVTIPGLGIAGVNADLVHGNKDLAKGDYVLYHTDGTDHYITECTSVTGQLYATNAAKNIVNINGTNYYLSELAGSDNLAAMTTIANTAGVTFYTDKGGNVVKAVASDATTDLTKYVYVKAAQDVGFSVQASIVTTTGVSSVVTVDKVGSTAVDDATDVPEGFYTFTTNTTGTYNLKVATTTNSVETYLTTRQAITKAQANFMMNDAGTAEGVLATSSTVFAYQNATTGAWTTYTGISNAPIFTTDNSSTVAYMCNANGYATFVIAYGGVIDTTSTTLDYAFVTSSATTIFDSTDGDYYQYTAVVNGKVQSVKADINGVTVDGVAAQNLAASTLYAITTYDDGKVSAVQAVADPDENMIQAFTAGTNVNDDEFNISGSTVSYLKADVVQGSFIVSDSCKFFIYDATKDIPTITESSLDELEGMTGELYTVQGVMTSETNANLAYVFVTIMP